MKLIKPSFEIIEQDCSIYNKPDADNYINHCKLLNGIYKQIELAGRTCYKSEDKITEDSAKPFVDRLTKSQHYAMLEHGTIYLKCSTDFCQGDARNIPLFKYSSNKYSKYSEHNLNAYVTTNLRVIAENNWWDDLKYLCEPTDFHSKRVTVKFILPIGISREFCRHRVFSFAEQSTRYCNFSKDKFNNEIVFIEPYWYESANNATKDVFNAFLTWSEGNYFSLINSNYKPQDAREVLPLCTKSELVMTGYIKDWNHFFDLRCDKAAHPQAQRLAGILKEEFIKRGYIKQLH